MNPPDCELSLISARYKSGRNSRACTKLELNVTQIVSLILIVAHSSLFNPLFYRSPELETNRRLRTSTAFEKLRANSPSIAVLPTFQPSDGPAADWPKPMIYYFYILLNLPHDKIQLMPKLIKRMLQLK